MFRTAFSVSAFSLAIMAQAATAQKITNIVRKDDGRVFFRIDAECPANKRVCFRSKRGKAHFCAQPLKTVNGTCLFRLKEAPEADIFPNDEVESVESLATEHHDPDPAPPEEKTDSPAPVASTNAKAPEEAEVIRLTERKEVGLIVVASGSLKTGSRWCLKETGDEASDDPRGACAIVSASMADSSELTPESQSESRFAPGSALIRDMDAIRGPDTKFFLWIVYRGLTAFDEEFNNEPISGQGSSVPVYRFASSTPLSAVQLGLMHSNGINIYIGYRSFGTSNQESGSTDYEKVGTRSAYVKFEKVFSDNVLFAMGENGNTLATNYLSLLNYEGPDSTTLKGLWFKYYGNFLGLGTVDRLLKDVDGKEFTLRNKTLKYRYRWKFSEGYSLTPYFMIEQKGRHSMKQSLDDAEPRRIKGSEAYVGGINLNAPTYLVDFNVVSNPIDELGIQRGVERKYELACHKSSNISDLRLTGELLARKEIFHQAKPTFKSSQGGIPVPLEGKDIASRNSYSAAFEPAYFFNDFFSTGLALNYFKLDSLVSDKESGGYIISPNVKLGDHRTTRVGASFFYLSANYGFYEEKIKRDSQDRPVSRYVNYIFGFELDHYL